MPIEISALLPTRNRAHFLPKVLEGLERQSLDRARFEIVAVDDGSSDETPQILEAWRDRLPLRIVRQNHAGISAAKNLSVFMAQGPILVFLDDDDVAEPDLLVAHLAAHIAYPDPAIAVLGHTRLKAELATIPVMHHVTEVGCQLFSYGGMKAGQLMGHTEFWGGRTSCKRGFLLLRGVFHPDFRFGCEDIELGWRLSRAGLKVLYEPRAITVMIRSLSFDDFCLRSYRQGRSQYFFSELRAEPEIRAYCEIDVAANAWARSRRDYASILRKARQLDRLAQLWQSAHIEIPPVLQSALETAYREAFFLSRAKGIVDAVTISAPRRQQLNNLSLLDFGVSSASG
ncbi:MAG: glycosyltransferase [Methylocystis sp.]